MDAAIPAPPFAHPKPSMRSLCAKTWVSVFCLSLIDAKPSQGVEYTLQANAEIGQDYTSNIMLLPKSLNPRGVWGTDLNVQTSFSAKAPTWQANGRGRFDNWFYYPLSGLDMQNQYLDASYAYFTERSRWELNGSYISDALLSSQSDPTIGIVLGRIRRDMGTVSPSFSYQLTEYTNLGLSYSYNNSKYPANKPAASASSLRNETFYPDSETHSVSATASHRATEKLSLNGVLSATTYMTSSTTAIATSRRINSLINELTINSGNVDREINYLNINLGFKYSLYDDIEISFSGGGQLSQTITDFIPNKSTKQLFLLGVQALGKPVSAEVPPHQISRSVPKFGPLFNIGISKRFDSSTVGLVYGHQISPSLNGTLFTSDHVALNATHQFSQRLGGGLQVSYNNSSFPYPGTSPVDQNAVLVGADISYTLMKNLIVNASYSYQLRTLAGGFYTGTAYAGTQDSNNVSVSLRYDIEPLHY